MKVCRRFGHVYDETLGKGCRVCRRAYRKAWNAQNPTVQAKRAQRRQMAIADGRAKEKPVTVTGLIEGTSAGQ